MVMIVLAWCVVTWLCAWLAVHKAPGWVGGVSMWLAGFVLSFVGGLPVGYLAELAGADVIDIMTYAATVGMGINLCFYPVNYWLIWRKKARR